MFPRYKGGTQCNKTIQLKPESVQDSPVFYSHNTNSNFPEIINSFPAIPLRFFEFSTPGDFHPYLINGTIMGISK